MKRVAAAVVAAGALAAGAFAAGIDVASFRYARTLMTTGGGPVKFQPDEPLLGHAKVGLGDLRVLDASGAQVPWRMFPVPTPGTRPVRVLNAGSEGGAAVATLDLGAVGGVRNRLALDIPARGFVATATVFGADRRDGPRTRLGATKVYDVAGAHHVRSTVVTFSPTDFRYLFVRVPGVPAIRGAVVATGGSTPQLVPRPAHVWSIDAPHSTLVVLDFGYPHIPVTEVRLASSTPRYDRNVEMLSSADGVHYASIAYGRISAASSGVGVDARTRFLRIKISNGDDPPLRDLRATALDTPRDVFVEGGHPEPYRVYYSSATTGPPSYDFARLPIHGTPSTGTLGPESANAAFRPGPDTRSFAAKHRWLVDGALALAAFVVAAGGLAALRRR